MKRYRFETPYPSVVSSVIFINDPSIVVITFTNDGIVYELRLENPAPLAEVTSALANCYQFRIVDIGQLEALRYEIEVWDEDCCYAKFSANSFEQVPVNVVGSKDENVSSSYPDKINIPGWPNENQKSSGPFRNPRNNQFRQFKERLLAMFKELCHKINRT